MKISARQRLRNRGFRSELRAEVKLLRNETNKETAMSRLKRVSRLLDKAVTRRLIHRKNADRNKSRLSRAVANLG